MISIVLVVCKGILAKAAHVYHAIIWSLDVLTVVRMVLSATAVMNSMITFLSIPKTQHQVSTSLLM